MKRIGAIGGIGWVGTRDYYSALNRTAAAAGTPFASADLVIRSLDFAGVLAQAADGAAVERTLLRAARDVTSAGAEVVAILSATGEAFAGEIDRAYPGARVSLATSCAESLARNGVDRVAIIGTRRMIESGGLARHLDALGITVVALPRTVTDAVDRAIFEEVEHERVGALTHAAFDLVVAECVRLAPADLLLACTELPFAWRAANRPFDAPMRVWDCVELHAAALWQAACSDNDARGGIHAST
jgi:aspartate racemase